MKKILLILFLVLSSNFANCETLKGSTSHTETLKGFFGIWHVTSKIESTNNHKLFNLMSVDIWNLSGAGNVLFLENGLTGAKSSISISEENYDLDGKKLKFVRTKEFTDGKYNYKHTETPEFCLEGNIFRGYDTFKIETFDLSYNPISIDVVKYKVIGQKITGD